MKSYSSKKECKVSVLTMAFALIGLAASECYSKEAEWVGAETCAQCHQEEHDLWQGSHHDWAMKPATPEYVLGDFDNVTLDHYGDKSRFVRRDDSFYVETANAQGELEIFKIAYTFGFKPLQQYLIAFPKGRLQALNLAWDSRPESEGGQRWFHLYPDERIAHDDVLHWTGPYFNWNSRCASCHSTNLEKNYDPLTQSYNTSWSEINVACEACHGPAEKHVQWANNPQSSADNTGFNRSLGVVGRWQRQQGEPTATLKVEAGAVKSEQLSTCGSCHSRRMLLDDPDKPGHFLDKHQLSLLNPPLYHPDGQIRDEVYVMGSFLQSKMYQEGVVCSNCHEPHSLKLRAEGNAVCAQCHNPSVFDTKKHHHHPTDSAGAQCANCHMPEQTYMVVDPRRDHSLRVPRPDLSVDLGTPNACTQCHEDETDVWAAEAMETWLTDTGKPLPPHYGEDIAAALTMPTDAEQKLVQLAERGDVPGIVRGTALSLLSERPGSQTLQTACANLNDKDPLVRIGALRAMSIVPPERRLLCALPLLNDAVKAVRVEAVRLLNEVPYDTLSSKHRTVMEKARAEYLTVLERHADTSNGQLNMGLFYVGQGDLDLAGKAYRKALELNPHNTAATLNLSDFYRAQNQDSKGEPLLRKAVELTPQDAGPYHSLGLLLIRQKRYEEAEKYLALAAELEPTNIRYGYVYAIALTSRGKTSQGLELLSKLHQRRPGNLEVLYALIDTHRRAAQWEQALTYAKKLQSLQTNNPQVEQLLRYLRQQIVNSR